ncbi:MAG: PAS domain S-box protein [Melioribacteraceae bacterium]|nr:PAS domain S-box protein [Melioribacteraceae bacterium]MCF8356826.1 PAS domain S-box protein [Melioribacteraceae bacterium]MCF8394032.1 PAS domain S-box protein [Melioribacteraceae bacterium]MCF8419765.1 PAS domain S-box protein [Melioribacteraceae bacterium]
MKSKDKKNIIAVPNKSISKNDLNPEKVENNFFENIVDTVREPLLILDEDLRVVKASRSFFDFFKVSPGETIGALIYDLGNQQWNIPKLRELLETILPEKAEFDNYEVEHLFSTIGKRVMLLNARQIEQALGKEKIILLAFEDVTERRGVEKALSEKSRLTDEYLKILLDHAHAPIIIWNSSFIIKRFNNGFEKLSGYNAAEMQNKKIDILFPKNKIVSTIELIKNNITDENSEVIEIDILTKDNRIKTVLWNSANILDKEEEKIVATIAQDITNRKQTEDALTILETRYRRLFESAKDGILILDAENGKIIDVNPFLCELLAYSKDKFIDKELWQIGFFDDIAANKEKFLELQQKEYVRYEDLPLETSDGRRINVEFVSNVYKVNRNEVIQCNIRDITERIQTKNRRTFVTSILSILNRPNDWKLLVKNILEEIKEFTGIEAAGIRFKDGDDYPYYETIGFPADFVEKKRFLCSKDSDGKVICDTKGNPVLECMCSNVISKRTDPSYPFFTKGRSFWTNSTTKLLVSTSEKDHQFRTRNRCNGEGYESVALIPLHSGEEVMGLLQLNDKRTKMFTSELIQTMEEIGATIGIAFKRMEIEKQIKESEEKFRIITENSADAIFITDDQGRYSYVNTKSVQMLGYSKEEMLHLTIADISPKDKVDEYFLIFKQLLNVGFASTEIDLVAKDGNLIPVDLNAVVLPNGFIFTSCRDISERIEIQNKIKFQADLLSNVGQAVIATDLAGKVVFWNNAAESIYGWTTDEAMGKNIIDLTPAEQTQEQASEIMKQLTAGNSWSGEFLVKRKDGSSFTSYVTDAPINDSNGKLLGVIGISSDITEKKRAESELLISEERYKTIFNNSLELIYIIDLEGQVLEANAHALNLLDYTLEDIKGLKYSDVLDPVDLPEASKNIEYVVVNGVNQGLQEYRIRTKNGGEIIIETTSVRLDRDGKPYGIMGIARNITDRKHTENEMIKAKEKAEESDKMKSEFLAQMSHEIRTPINVVLGYTEYLNDLIGDKKDSETDDCFTGINLASKRIIRTIDLILNAAELQTGTYQPNFVTLNLDTEILNKIYREQRLTANHRGLELIYNCELNDPEIFADDYSTTQIFANLIDNAIKYTKKGRVEILITNNIDSNIVAEIKDTGIGIAEEFLSKLFDPFTQEEQGYSRSFEGNGLGLSLVQKYCEINHAKIEVESEKNVGSTFRIIFDKKFTGNKV